MMAITHSAIACASTSVLLGTASPLLLGLSVIGSQLPDLDTTESTIGKIFFPIASWIEDRFPHRTITHCLLTTLGLGIISLGLCLLLGVKDSGIPLWHLAIALPLGHLSSVFADSFTLKGVQLFYPYGEWCFGSTNPRRRLKTGGTGELWVLGISMCLIAVGIQLASGGGLSTQLGQGLGLSDALITQYNTNANTNIVYANIKGVKNSDRSTIEGKFPIITITGTNFLIREQEDLYTLGTDITTNKIKLEIGSPQTTKLYNLNFDEEYLIDKFNAVVEAFPSATVYLTGTITIDLPEEVTTTTTPGTTPTITITGTTANLNYCTITKAIDNLDGQYGTGQLLMRVITSS